jgi:drug/metabolite transporter (DMT)-like permease
MRHNARMTHGRPKPATLSVVVALATVYVVWGSTYLAIAYVVETMPPFLAAGARFLVAGGMLLAYLLAQDRWLRRTGREGIRGPRLIEWRTALVVGGLLLLGGNGMVMQAEKTVPSGIAAVLIATVPIWMSLFDAIVTRRRPGPLVIGGLLVGLAGVAILLYPTEGVAGLDPFGIGLVIFAAIAWATGSIYARHGPMPRNQLLGTGMQQIAGGACLLLAALAVGDFANLDLAAVTLESWLGLAFLVVFGSLVGYTAFVWLLGNVPVTTASTYAYVNPVVAVVLGMLFRDEQLTVRTLLAVVLIIGAVVAMVTGRPREAEEAGLAPEAVVVEPASEEAGA